MLKRIICVYMLVYISRLLSRRLFCDAFFSHSKGVCGGGNTRKARARSLSALALRVLRL